MSVPNVPKRSFGRFPLVSANGGFLTTDILALQRGASGVQGSQYLQYSLQELAAYIGGGGGSGAVWGGITAAMVGAPAGSGTSTGTNTGDNLFVAASAPVTKGFPNLQIDTTGGNLQFWVET